MTPPENGNQVSRGSCCRSSVRDSRLVSRINCQDDCVAFGGYNIRMNLIQIENDPRDEWIRAVLSSAHLAHTIQMHRNIFEILVADRVWKIQQDAVWVDRCLNRGFDWTAEGNLYAQIRSFSCCGHVLHRRRTSILCRSARQQEHRNRKMFLDCRHSSLTLAGAPPAA